MQEHFKDVDMSHEQQKELLEDLPSKWDIHCDLIMFPSTSFTCDYWNTTTENLWKMIANIFGVRRIALKSKIVSDDYRTPQVVMKLGDNGIVQHVDNGIRYAYDITKNMFSKGNITEKLRISKFNCRNEVVVDLFAGIGYFTLPYLMKANAKRVYACDWNTDAIAFLKHNIHVNKVDGRCVVLEGDNRQVVPKNFAHRVNLGLIPTSSASWQVACEALKSDTGGWLHIHENIESEKITDKKCECISNGHTCLVNKAYKKSASEAQRIHWCSFVYRCKEKLKGYLGTEKSWTIHLNHVEYVKSYAPHVDHLVFDFECRPKS